MVGNALHVANLSDRSNISAKRLLPLESYGTQLIVSGDSLIVVQTLMDGQVLETTGAYRFAVPKTSVTLYDITDRMSPQAVSTTVVEGTNSNVRFSGGMLSLVQSNITTLIKPALVTDSSGVQRFETLDSYYANNRDSIVAALLPNYGQSPKSALPETMVDAGTWDDLSFANNNLGRATSIVRFQLGAESLTLTDAETIAGVDPHLVYQGLEDVYITTNATWGSSNESTFIYKVDATDDGQLKTLGVAAVKGRLLDTTWLNEHNGILQVASSANTQVPLDPNIVPIRVIGETVLTIIPPRPITTMPIIDPWWNSLVRNSANITTIGDTADGWKVLGTLEDIGDGQSLLAASFVGDQAVVTTGTPQFFDPLHGIDLSDPASPKELSELVIPGFTTYLMQIDATHWLGFGYTQDAATRLNEIQVSLYEGSDLSDPRLVDRWTLSNSNGGRTWDPHAISYDPDTGLLVMSAAQQWTLAGVSQLPVLKVDTSADDQLQEVGFVGMRDYFNRSFTLDNVLVVTTAHSITTYDVTDLSRLSQAFLTNYDALNYAYWTVRAGETQDWKLADQWTGEPFVITSIETSGPITATLKPDQATVQLSAPADTLVIEQSANVYIRFASGATHMTKVTLRAGDAYGWPMPDPIYSDGRASIGAQFTDDAGNVITDLSAGDEVWVTVSITDLRDNPVGIFGGYVDVEFTSKNVTVVGELEHLDFANGKLGSVGSDVIKSFGGFGGATLPETSTSQLGRFKIRVNDDQPVTINITPSMQRNEEVLAHGLNSGLDPANVVPVQLTTQSETMRTMVTAENRHQDVNEDGVITALDVLQVINHINTSNAAAAESVSALRATQAAPTRFDISGDGFVTALDALQIINTINARSGSPASGEGESLDAAAIDQIMAVDLDTLVRKK